MTSRHKIAFAILGTIAALISLLLILRNPYAARKHQAAYEATRDSYRTNLKPGMPRSAVEEYLRSRGVQFSKFGGMDLRGEETSTWADGISLGREPAPLSDMFFCEDSNVTLELTFRAVEPRAPSRLTARDSDVLVDIRLNRSEICI